MANSSIIGSAKNKIIKELIKDEEIILAIGCEDIISTDNSEELINTHIFNYNQNPNTLEAVGTFITIQVHIPHKYARNDVFVEPTVEVWIISHEKHMSVDNVPKVTENRNDYLSRLIDNKLNGRSDFGIGGLSLSSNVEGSYQTNYLYRQMVFSCKDLTKKLCVDE